MNCAPDIWSFLNSNLVTSAIGAFAGAVAAFYIVDWNERRKILAQEIRNYNSAIALTFDVYDSFVSIRATSIKPIINKYKVQRELYTKALSEGDAALKKFIETCDARLLRIILSHTHTDMDALRQVILEKISLSGPFILVLSALIRVSKELDTAIVNRNNIIDSYRSSGEEKSAIVMKSFSNSSTLTNKKGTDTRFSDANDAIEGLTDLIIYFSKNLCELLQLKAELIAAKIKNLPEVHKYKLETSDILDLSDEHAVVRMIKEEKLNLLRQLKRTA